MISELFRHSGVYTLSIALSQGVTILMVPIYTRLLSAESYGVLDILTIGISLVNLTVALEISQGLARYFGEASSEPEKAAYASTALWFTLSCYGVFSLVGLWFSTGITAVLLGAGQWRGVVETAVLAASCNGVYLLMQNQLRWLLSPWRFAATGGTYALVTTATALFLVGVAKTGVIGIFYAQMAGSFAGGVIAWYYGKGLYGRIFSPTMWLRMIAFSLPLVPSSVSLLLANYVDRFAIKHFMTLDAVGVYGVGFRLASLVNLFIAGFSVALSPLIYRYYARESTPGELARVLKYFMAGTTPLILGISLFPREILWLFTTPEYYGAWQVIPLLAVASVLLRMYIFAPGLDLTMKTGRIALINICGALINVVLNVLLVPILGIVGAALATLVCGVFIFSGYMVSSQKVYKIPYEWRRILPVALGIPVVIVGGLFLSAGNSILSWPSTVLKALLWIVASLWACHILLDRMEKQELLRRCRLWSPL